MPEPNLTNICRAICWMAVGAFYMLCYAWWCEGKFAWGVPEPYPLILIPAVLGALVVGIGIVRIAFWD